MNSLTQVKEGGSDPVGSEYFYRIWHDFCRISFDRNPDRIPIERNPTKTVSDPIGFLWKMSGSDEIRHGFDRIYRSDPLPWGMKFYKVTMVSICIRSWKIICTIVDGNWHRSYSSHQSFYIYSLPINESYIYY